MTLIEGPASAARTMARALGAFAWTAGISQAAELRLRLTELSRREDVYRPWIRTWARGVLSIVGVRVTVLGTVPPLTHRPRLVVANHRSALDIPALISQFAGAVVSRADLANWPVLGSAATQAGCIFVDADSRASGIAAIRAVRAALMEGRTVSIFPEGTTFSGDEVRPFQRGAFAAADRLDAELVPVGLAWAPPAVEYTQSEFLAHVRDIGRTPDITLTMAIGTRESLTLDSRAAAKHYRGVVQDLVDRARAHAQAQAHARR